MNQSVMPGNSGPSRRGDDRERLRRCISGLLYGHPEKVVKAVRIARIVAFTFPCIAIMVSRNFPLVVGGYVILCIIDQYFDQEFKYFSELIGITPKGGCSISLIISWWAGMFLAMLSGPPADPLTRLVYDGSVFCVVALAMWIHVAAKFCEYYPRGGLISPLPEHLTDLLPRQLTIPAQHRAPTAQPRAFLISVAAP